MDRRLLTEVAALLVDKGSSVGAKAQRELLAGEPLGAEARSIVARVARYERERRSVMLKMADKRLAAAIARAPRHPDPRFATSEIRHAVRGHLTPADPRLARQVALAATELSRKEPLDLARTLYTVRPDALPLREIVVARHATPPARLTGADMRSIAARLEPGARLLELAPLLVDTELDDELLRRRRAELLAYWVAVPGLRRRGLSRHGSAARLETYDADDVLESVPLLEHDAPAERMPRPTTEHHPPAKRRPPRRPGAAHAAETVPRRHAWPLLEAPDGVGARTEFTVTVGLSPSPVAGVSGTGRLSLPAGPFTLDLELVVDADSFEIVDGPARRSLAVTEADPFPKLTMKLSAFADDALKRVRQLGCTFMIDGLLCGYATRLIEVVPEGTEPEGIAQPAGVAPPIDLFELDQETLPDLTIVIENGDDLAGTKLIWKLYSPCMATPVDIDPRDVGAKPQEFTSNIIDTGNVATSDPLGLFDHLVGAGLDLGLHMPPEVRSVLTDLPANVTNGVPAVLIATADPYLPWELAILDKNLPIDHPEESPFLGGRVAIGRWPLTSERPAPKPLAAVVVKDRAVVSGSYMKVQGIEELEAAKAEGEELLASWPGAHSVEPTYAKVRALLRGTPGADVVHVALHGRFSDTIRNGLVLIGTDEEGFRTPYYLQPKQVRGWKLKRRPFIFLNACQVAGGTRVLGDHAGMASSLLTAGAASVIAPLWSIDDKVAHSMATAFYKAALDAPAGQTVAIAEILRRARARFTEAAIESGQGAGFSTHLAFQYFGHPRLELRKAPG